MDTLSPHSPPPHTAATRDDRDLDRALEIFAEYDTARLLAYRHTGDPSRVAIEKIGGSLALRFTEVGYFNRVYHVDSNTLEHMEELAAFYEPVQQPVQLLAAAGTDLAPHTNELEAFRFAPGPSYARVGADLSDLPTETQELPPGVEVVTPGAEDQETILDVYLRGFGAEKANIEAAKINMRRLFNLPNLYFSLGRVDGTPVGLGMLYVSGQQAYLCGGTTLPSHARRGCHTALIRHRLDQARELGATRAVSWAYDKSESQKNMVAQGLSTLTVDRAWDRPWTSSGAHPE